MKLRAIGTDVIDRVEILRHIKGSPGFTVVERHAPAREVFELRCEIEAPAGEAVYYVRLKQRRLVGGRPAMAWSSPIWVGQGGGS